MKDLIITQSHLAKEMKYVIAFLVIGFLMNVYAIISYDGQWQELFTQLHVVFVLSLVLYFITGLVRIGYLLVMKFRGRIANKVLNEELPVD
ncbi:MAG: hypothetical protein WD098_08905 [Balneolales bacterium]